MRFTQQTTNGYATILLIILVVLAVGVAFFWNSSSKSDSQSDSVITNNSGVKEMEEGEEGAWETTLIAENLDIPWDIAFLPDDTMLVTERSGQVLHVESERSFAIDGVRHIGEGGLLGIALHPDFEENSWVYLYQTTDTADGLENRVVRYLYDGDLLSFDQIILENIPGARYHDGGRIDFGPDGYLYIATGDAGDESSAQDTTSLAGSILRINDDGSIPEDNPFANAIYSYGHRNPQGLAWDNDGRLWSTEHGRSGLRSGYDEVNLIERGENYGWPESEGDTVLSGTTAPKLHSGASDTWAPASAAFWNGSIFFGGLRGAALYEAQLDGENVSELITHFDDEFGRIRTVRVGPNNSLYLTTSNTDGRGSPEENDDKIIRLTISN